MPLIETFSQKEVSTLRHGLSSTLSPLAPPFTINRNPANPSPNSSQTVDPSFDDFFSSMSASLDTWLHLHPPSASDGVISLHTPAVSSVPDFPPSAFSRVSDGSTYPSGSYGYVGASTNAGFGQKSTVPEDPYRAIRSPAVAVVSDCPSYPSGSYGYAGVPGKPDLGEKRAVSDDPYCISPSKGSSSLPEDFQYPSEYGYYCIGVAPDGSSASGGFNESLCAYESSNIWGSFQGGELRQEKQVSDIERSNHRFLPEIKTFRSNLEFPQQRELPPQPTGTSANEGTSVTCGRKYDDSRHTQGSSSQADFKFLHDRSAEMPDMSTQPPLIGFSGTSPSPCTTPPSDVLPATRGWTFMSFDSVLPNRCFIQNNSCQTDPSVVHPGTSCYPFVQVFQPPPAGDLSSNETVVSENVSSGSFFPVDPFRHMNPDADTFSAGKVSINSFSVKADPAYDFVGSHDSSNNRNNNYLQLMDNSFSSCQGGVNYLSDGRSVENPEKSVWHSNLSNPSGCEQVVDDSALSVQYLSEKNDQLISAVDSPCWKGIPVFHHSPFEATEAVSLPHCLKTLELCEESVDLHGGIFPHSKALNQSFWTSNECVNASPPSVDMTTQLSANGDEITAGACKSYAGRISKGTHKKLEPCIASSCGQEIELKILSGSSLTKEEPGATSSEEATISETTEADCSNRIHRPIQDGLSDFLSQPIGHRQSSGCAGTSVSTVVLESLNGLSDNSSLYVPESSDAHIVLKAMYDMSALLLSRSYTDGNALQEDSLEILQLVINNLEQLTLKQEACKSESWSPLKSPYTDACKAKGLSGPEYIRADLIDGRLHSHNKETSGNGRPVPKNGIPMKIKSHRSASIAGGVHFDEENVVLQAMDVLLRNNPNDGDEDHPRIRVYKTLWLEAEAALCAMKYEARLARMEMEVLKAELHRDFGCTLGESSGSKDSPQDVQRVDDGIDGNIQKSHELKSLVSDHAEVESSVIGRFKILQEHIERSSKLEEPPVLPDAIDIEDYTNPQIEKAESENHKHRRDTLDSIDAMTSFCSKDIRNINHPNKDYDGIDSINQNLRECGVLLSDYDDMEASVAARFQILKQRCQKSDNPGGSTSLPDSIDIETVDCNQQKEETLLPSCFRAEVLKADPGSNFPCSGLQKWLELDAKSESTRLQSVDNLHGSYTQVSGAYALPTGNFQSTNHLAWEKLDTEGTFWPYGTGMSCIGTSPSSPGVVLDFKKKLVERFKGSDKGAVIGGSSSSQSDFTYDWEHVLKEEITC